MGISDFILARVAEEEEAAHAALDGRPPAERWQPPGGDHVEPWNPWRVQSACLVRRLIVRAHRNTGPAMRVLADGTPHMTPPTCRTCRDAVGEPAAWPCYTLRVLASEWAHHPDYRDEWQPTRLSSARRR